MTTVQGLVMNDSGFIEKIAHSGPVTPPFMTKSPKVEWDVEPDVTMNLDTTRPPVFSTRASRPRISNKRSRPYQDMASRPSSHQRAAPPCRYFQAGKCINGDNCRYKHVARSTSPESDLDQQLLAFVKGENPEETDNSTSSISTPKVTYNPDDFPDEEELYEVITHPSSIISEVRFNTRSNPAELRTYFVAQRQAVVEYEGNNVGILSGGVLLGVPTGSSAPTSRNELDDEPLEDVTESETASSSSPSPVSNDSNHEQWKGPVWFDNSATVEAESLVWADEEVDDAPMETIDLGLDTYTLASNAELPYPPPVIRRIIRQVDGHNRRHSLS
ncbi:unnamed protein product [Rhizoctonia solani]|uniref:C3H1-type domain-containing protein n=1 Tax=Rhizoctonia solani TaxID=456999 RepID=A0A8H3CNV8_9AGAM|nr:unnamed protein product [Rhizoctonia solani]